MGASQSSDADTSINDPLSSLSSVAGWKVLKVLRHSPCDGLGLVPYFDVITHFNAIRLTDNERVLLAMIQPRVPLRLTVLSLATRQSRALTVTPHGDWSANNEGLLGLMIRYDSLELIDLECLHVLTVYPHSPADRAGLQPYTDWLLGTDRLAFKGWSQLDHWLESTDRRESTIAVFNSVTWRVREIPLTPDSRWGGTGSLGCDVAQGFVHRLPVFEDNERRAVRLDHRSEVRTLATAESSGLHREDGQLMLRVNVNGAMLFVRVREPEDFIAPASNNHSNANNHSTTGPGAMTVNPAARALPSPSHSSPSANKRPLPPRLPQPQPQQQSLSEPQPPTQPATNASFTPQPVSVTSLPPVAAVASLPTDPRSLPFPSLSTSSNVQ